MEFTEVIIPAITGLISFAAGLRRGKIQNESLILQNIERAISVYQTIIEDLKEEIISLNKKVDELQQKIDEMETKRRTTSKK